MQAIHIELQKTTTLKLTPHPASTYIGDCWHDISMILVQYVPLVTRERLNKHIF